MAGTSKPRPSGPFPLPESEVSERWVIGSLIKKPELLEKIDIDPEHFYHEQYREIYQAILNIRQRGQEITQESVIAELPPEISSWVITTIVDDVTAPEQCPQHARIVIKKSNQRDLVEIANKMLKEANTEKDPQVLIGEALSELTSITSGRKASRFVMFEKRRKLNTDPPMYFLEVSTVDKKQSKVLRVTLEELFSKKRMQRIVAAALNINPILPKRYDDLVNDIIATATITEAPEYTSRDETIIYWLRDWWKTASEAEFSEDLNTGYIFDDDCYWIHPNEVIKRINETTRIKVDNTTLFGILEPYGAKRSQKAHRLKDKIVKGLWPIPKEFFEQPLEEEPVDELQDMSWLEQ